MFMELPVSSYNLVIYNINYLITGSSIKMTMSVCIHVIAFFYLIQYNPLRLSVEYIGVNKSKHQNFAKKWWKKALFIVVVVDEFDIDT